MRRLVARTMAQQMSDVVEATTAPYQHALSTRAGTECIAHALQLLTEGNPRATVLSIDGHVRMFCGQPSSYLWEGDDGTVHHIEQGELGEQGDPLENGAVVPRSVRRKVEGKRWNERALKLVTGTPVHHTSFGGEIRSNRRLRGMLPKESATHRTMSGTI